MHHTTLIHILRMSLHTNSLHNNPVCNPNLKPESCDWPTLIPLSASTMLSVAAVELSWMLSVFYVLKLQFTFHVIVILPVTWLCWKMPVMFYFLNPLFKQLVDICCYVDFSWQIPDSVLMAGCLISTDQSVCDFNFVILVYSTVSIVSEIFSENIKLSLFVYL